MFEFPDCCKETTQLVVWEGYNFSKAALERKFFGQVWCNYCCGVCSVQK
jgi:hypothetical protein